MGGLKRLADKKKKQKQIHVDKLIINADEVVIQNDEMKADEERRVRRDPWGFVVKEKPDMPQMNEEENITQKANEEADDEKENNDDDDDHDRRPHRRFSWI